jgi:AraC family L-rhamnose operon transcriptional activator RhaR
VNVTRTPLKLQGADYYVPSHAPLRTVVTILDGDLPLHDHDFVEIVLVRDGQGIHRTIYGDKPIGRGDVIILRPGAWHGFQACDALELYETRFAVELLAKELVWDDPFIDQLVWTAPDNLDRRGLLHVRLGEPELAGVGRIAHEIFAGVTSDGAWGRAEEVARLHALLAGLSRAIADHALSGRRGRPEPHQAVTDGIRLMEADLRRDWNLPELAKRLGVDKSYLVRLFRAQTGSPPMQFLSKMRAEWAAVLLLRTTRDVAVIGQQVGWDDPNYFARRFKAEFGMSATKFRERFAELG